MSHRVELIPIAEIRIVNPRSRNRITFRSITANIATVGLKKPITVYERALESDGTKYDLIFGQGRLESFRELGDTMIPAIIRDVPEEERYLMSLVENLARRPPSTTDILREVKRLRAQHYKPMTIAQKLGVDQSYIYGIINLLRRGEEGLVASVEAGRLPIDTAIKIATGTDEEVQRALSEAYEKGTLRGKKLRVVQQLITRRKAGKSTSDTRRQLSGDDLVREYERHTQQQRSLVRRSALITERLAVLTTSFQRLLADDHFVTLLRAEGLQTLPDHLAARANGLS
jgi:ParB family transcriptional regulator, chromosome partitioning protein